MVFAYFQRLFHVLLAVQVVVLGDIGGVGDIGGQVAAFQLHRAPPALVVDRAVMHAQIAGDLRLAVPLAEHFFNGQSVVPGQVCALISRHRKTSICNTFA